MTITYTANRVVYSGNGTTTVFSVPFEFISSSDLRVILTLSSTNVDTDQTLTTHYTVSGGSGSTGSVTMLTAPPSGYTLTIYNDPAITQSTDYVANDPFPAETHERALDKLTIISKRLADRADRALSLPEGYPFDDTLSVPPPSANAVIGWNSTATALENKAYDSNIVSSTLWNTGKNRAPNTAWQSRQQLSMSTKQNAAGAASLAGFSGTANSTGSTTVVLSTTDAAFHDYAQVGWLVKLATGLSGLTDHAYEIVSINPGVSFTIKTERNFAPGGTAVFTGTFVARGDIVGVTGDGPDGWKKSTTLICALDDHSTNRDRGFMEQILLRKTVTGPEYFLLDYDQTDFLGTLAGMPVVHAARIMRKVGTGILRLVTIINGTFAYGSNVAVDSAYHHTEQATTVPDSACTEFRLGIVFDGVAGDIAYVSRYRWDFGTSIGENGFVQDMRETIMSRGSNALEAYTGAAVTFPAAADAAGTYGFEVNLYQASNGAISKYCREIGGMLEGTSATAGAELFMRSNESPPIFYAPLAGSVNATNQKCVGGGPLKMRAGAKAWMYSDTSAVAFTGVSVDVYETVAAYGSNID